MHPKKALPLNLPLDLIQANQVISAFPRQANQMTASMSCYFAANGKSYMRDSSQMLMATCSRRNPYSVLYRGEKKGAEGRGGGGLFLGSRSCQTLFSFIQRPWTMLPVAQSASVLSQNGRRLLEARTAAASLDS